MRHTFHNTLYYNKAILSPRISFSLYEIPPIDLTWPQRAGAHLVHPGNDLLFLQTQPVCICLDPDNFQEKWRRKVGDGFCGVVNVMNPHGDPLWIDNGLIYRIDPDTGTLIETPQMKGFPAEVIAGGRMFIEEIGTKRGVRDTLSLVDYASGDAHWTYDMTDLRTSGSRLDEEYCVLWGMESFAIIDSRTGKEMHRRSFDEWLARKLQFMLRDVPKHAQFPRELYFGPRMDDVVLAGGESGYVLALDIPTCEILWVRKLPMHGPVMHMVLVEEGLLVHASYILDIETGEVIYEPEGVRFEVEDPPQNSVVLKDDVIMGNNEHLFRWSISNRRIVQHYKAPGRWFGPPATVSRDKIIWKIEEPFALAVWDIGSSG